MKVSYKPMAVIDAEEAILRVAANPFAKAEHELILDAAYAADLDWKYIDAYTESRKSYLCRHSKANEKRLMHALEVLYNLLEGGE